MPAHCPLRCRTSFANIRAALPEGYRDDFKKILRYASPRHATRGIIRAAHPDVFKGEIAAERPARMF